MSSQFPSNNPTGYFGISATNPGQNWFRRRDPLPSDFKNYIIGDRWINIVNNSAWVLTSKNASSGTWMPSAGGAVSIDSVTPDVGAAIIPIASNINITGDSAQGVSTLNFAIDTMQITVQDTSETVKGVVQLASNAETLTGTNTTKALTVDDLSVKLGIQTANCVILSEGTTSALSNVAVGAAGQVLQSSGAGFDPLWTTATYPATTTAGQVLLSSANNVVSSSPNITSDSLGIITMPSQSGASAYLSAPIANATGDLTQVTIAFDSEDYDIQGEYNVGTGEFTVKDAGIYLITTNVLLGNIGVAHNIGNLQIKKNADIWWQSQYNPSASAEIAGQLSVNGSVIIQCASADILKVLVQVGGGAKTVTISSAAGAHTTLQISKIA